MLALLVEEVTGMPVDRVLRERIFLPAGMEQSTLGGADAPARWKAHGYDKGQDVTFDPLPPFGAGGLVSTAGDEERDESVVVLVNDGSSGSQVEAIAIAAPCS